MRTVIAIALHKAAPLPTDPMYLPVQAGAAGAADLGVTRDDTGDHISDRNPLYCELTVHYWLWRNVTAEAYGLCHYRRYFTRSRTGRSLDRVLTPTEAEALLEEADVIVPRPRPYLIETNASHYAHAHRAADLDLTRTVIAERCPAYLDDFDRVMKRRWGRRFNMCIMRRDVFTAYSAWLFDVLMALEQRMGADAPPRTLGYIAERLIDVWLTHEKPRLKELRVLHTERQHWGRKIASFLIRKATGGKSRGGRA